MFDLLCTSEEGYQTALAIFSKFHEADHLLFSPLCFKVLLWITYVEQTKTNEVQISKWLPLLWRFWLSFNPLYFYYMFLLPVYMHVCTRLTFYLCLTHISDYHEAVFCQISPWSMLFVLSELLHLFSEWKYVAVF